jgi:hypothetical protein
MAALVDRHAVHCGAQVGTVIEVEAAQVELVGLAFASPGVASSSSPGR